MSQTAVESTLFGGAEEAKPLSPEGVLNEEAVKLSLDQKHEEALEKYNKAISETKDDDEKLPIFLSNRAHSLVSMDRLDEAIADCERAEKLDPKCVMSYVAHSKAYAYKNKLGQALDLLRKALSKDKENKGLQQKIRMIEGEQKLDTMVAKNDPNRQKMNQYIDWLKGQGVECPKVKVRMIDQRTTVVLATKDIQKDEQVLFIPADLMLQLENAGDVPANSWLLWNPKVGERVSKKEQHTVAMYYLHEKNNSKWKYKRYFDSLRQDNSNHVVLWEQEHLDVLKASWLNPHIQSLQKAVEGDYDLIQKEMPAETRGEFTLQEYKEAWVIADQHFQGIVKEDYATHALVPFLNYLTYNDDTSTYTKFDTEKNGLQVLAARRIQRGDEVCLRAVSPSNDYFLMKKGESHRQKPTRLPFAIKLSKQDPMYQLKVEAMGGKSDQRIFHLTRNMNDPQFMEYIHFMRFYLWTGSAEELKNMRAREIQRKQQLKIPISEETAFQGTQCMASSSRSETFMWQQVQGQIQGRMQSYPVGIEETKKVLTAAMTIDGPQLTPAQRAAQEYLLEEQLTIVGIMQMSMVFVELLAKSWEDFVKELNEKPFYQQWRGYIETSIMENKKNEDDFAKQLAAAKAAQAAGGEAVKQLPAGADAGKGSLY